MKKQVANLRNYNWGFENWERLIGDLAGFPLLNHYAYSLVQKPYDGIPKFFQGYHQNAF